LHIIITATYSIYEVALILLLELQFAFKVVLPAKQDPEVSAMMQKPISITKIPLLVPIVQEAGWASELVWMQRLKENLLPLSQIQPRSSSP
jgi:hypothetical protein